MTDTGKETNAVFLISQQKSLPFVELKRRGRGISTVEIGGGRCFTHIQISNECPFF